MRRTVEADGIRIAFDDVGGGSPALVFVHGAFADRSEFAPQVEHFADRHRVIAVDLRGHGESEIPASGFAFADFVADVLAVLDAARPERVVIGGHSVLGGGTGLEVAAARPELVAGVALLDASIPYPEPLRVTQLERFVPLLEGDGRAVALQEFIGRTFDPRDSAELRAWMAAGLARAPAHLAAPLMRAVFSEDFSESLASGRYPLLHVHARAPVDLDRLRELRPDALLGSVIGSGHYLTMSATDQLDAMLERFLAIIERS